MPELCTNTNLTFEISTMEDKKINKIHLKEPFAKQTFIVCACA